VGAALLQGKQLLGTEGLVVGLRGGLDEILEVGAEEEVAEVDELAVGLILDIDDTPSVLATTDLLAVDDDRLLGSNDGKGNEALLELATASSMNRLDETYLDLSIQSTLLVVKLLVIVREHLQVMESKLLLDALLEGLALLDGQCISLGDDGDNVDNIRQLLEDDNVDGLEGMAGRLDEEEAAVNAGVGNVTLSLRGELLSQVRGVLILDILDDGVPAAVVVDEVAVAGGVNNVEPQTHAVLLDEVGNGLDLGSGADGLVGLHTTLGVDEVGGEDGVDQCGLAETGLTWGAESVSRYARPQRR
jgi:hypothetical protein